MEHPEWALKFKTKNTELRLIRGRYYLYNITSKWDPEKKRTKKVTLGSVGTILRAVTIPSFRKPKILKICLTN